MEVIVNSENVKYSDNYIESRYDYQYTTSERIGNQITVTPKTEQLVFRTQRKLPRLGVMLVGWGGNNGCTFTAALIANQLGLTWPTRRGTQKANWFGSITQSSTIPLGGHVNVPLASLLPTVHPNDIAVDGWDISGLSVAQAMERAQVLEPTLQELLKPHMKKYRPRPSIYAPDFIAANQSTRADNVLGGNKQKQVKQIMKDIEDFRNTQLLDKVIVLWTANTERFSEIIPGVNDTEENLKKSIANNHAELSPSTLFAYASISMGCPYINGSPQNTFVPGLVEFAESRGVYIGGDDFKSGQTKLKSVIVDFLVSAGIKPVSIVSYNHLGNNDGKNLSAPAQFKSKEVIQFNMIFIEIATLFKLQISKSNVVDDMVSSNEILYQPGEKPDHVVVIKYVPYVGKFQFEFQNKEAIH
ncbi:hypothetical protein WA026_000290 [Henosepilachna vigintioctopunctata]|uniref:inositol-3-phosphate synthase n=1 Tax=Henosepilachna vigintioctopunctata TaxID=420089 RepID=A0AAW1V7M7_9CUCU